MQRVAHYKEHGEGLAKTFPNNYYPGQAVLLSLLAFLTKDPEWLTLTAMSTSVTFLKQVLNDLRAETYVCTVISLSLLLTQ